MHAEGPGTAMEGTHMFLVEAKLVLQELPRYKGIDFALPFPHPPVRGGAPLERLLRLSTQTNFTPVPQPKTFNFRIALHHFSKTLAEVAWSGERSRARARCGIGAFAPAPAAHVLASR